MFGSIGEDPGVAWEQDGVSTRAANLLLKDSVGIGSRGWSDPSLRFVSNATPGAFHLGTPPALEDPYVAWVEAFGLKRETDGHPDADLDGDLLTNAGEFGFFTHPQMSDRHATTGNIKVDASIGATVNPVFIRRPDDGRVVYLLESSGDLARWETEPFMPQDATIVADGRERLRAVSLLKILRSTRYYRFSAILP